MSTQPLERTHEALGHHITVAAIVWCGGAFLALLVVPFVLETTTPVFQLFWLLVSTVALLTSRTPARLNIRRVPPRTFVTWVVVGSGVYLGLVALVEPWTHVYERLLSLAFAGPDPTFVWLVRFDGAGAWTAFLLFSGLVTLFTEEVFFRGWLQATLTRRVHPRLAIVGQALAFTTFQSLPVLFFSPVQAVAYLVVYAFGLGLITGLLTDRAGSILPGLGVVTLGNAVLTFTLGPLP